TTRLPRRGKAGISAFAPAVVSSSPCTRRAKRSAARRGSLPPPCPPAVGAADRELRCAGTAVERAGAVKVAGHHSLSAGGVIVVRIRHRAFLSDFDRSERVEAVDSVYRASPREPPRASARSHARRSRKR